MTFNYLKRTQRLNVYGSDGLNDIQEIKKLMQEGTIPSEISTIFYQKSQYSSVGMLFRGRYLENLLKAETESGEETKKPSFRTILKTINDTNSRQSTFSGLLIYATNSKRFLFLMPKNRNNLYGLLGDPPREGEDPTETVCRIAKEDCEFELTQNCLVSLIPIVIDGTTFYNYLVLSNHEFKPPLSERLIRSAWTSYEAMEDLPLQPSVVQLFEKDPKLQRLISPIQVDFEKLIDEILHSQ